MNHYNYIDLCIKYFVPGTYEELKKKTTSDKKKKKLIIWQSIKSFAIKILRPWRRIIHFCRNTSYFFSPRLQLQFLCGCVRNVTIYN